MNKKRVLMVGGTFNIDGGKKSSLIEKIFDIAKTREDIIIDLHNGGKLEELHSTIIEKCKNYDIVMWMPHVSNNEEKVRNVKEINPKTILISSKRNDNKYSFGDLISHSLKMKANLTIEFKKVADKKFKMMVFDPLGNEFYDGTDISQMVTELMNRAIKLTTFTRQSTSSNGLPSLNVPNEEEFFNFARSCSDIFHNLINPSANTTRFLGNMSFRCQNGFPSFRGENGIVFVSQRNIDKSKITKDSFVATYLDENGSVKYYGDKKPSVDTPVQLQLYKMYPQMNYMIHAHCYFKPTPNMEIHAPYTYKPIPCGALEEVEEIQHTIINELDVDDTDSPELVAVNLTGHGCLLMAKNISAFTKLMKQKDNCFIKRQVPENTLKDIKQKVFNRFKNRRHPNINFSNENNMSVVEFERYIKDKKIAMVEDEYCCHGLFYNCWQELYEVGCWGMKEKCLKETVLDTYRFAMENYPDRVFTAKRSGTLCIAIVSRDFTKSDYRIYIE